MRPVLITLYILLISAVGIPCDAQEDICNKVKRLVHEHKIDSAELFLHLPDSLFNIEIKLCINKQISKFYRNAGQPVKSIFILQLGIDEKELLSQSNPVLRKAGWSYYATLGYTYNNDIGDIDAALDNYLMARQILIDSLHLSDKYIASALLVPIGNIYTRLGDYDLAMRYLDRAYKILMDLGEFDWAARLQVDQSTLHTSRSEYEKALQLLLNASGQSGLSAFTKTFIFSKLAEAHILHQQYDEAIEVARMGLKERYNIQDLTRQSDKDHLLPDLLESIGVSFSLFNLPDSANKYFEKAIHEKTLLTDTETHRELAKKHLNYANHLVKHTDVDRALLQYQMALDRCVPNFESNDASDLPNPDLIIAENTIANALYGKAKALQRKYASDQQARYLKQAITCYELMFHTWNKLRETHLFQSSQKNLQAEIGHMILSAVQAARRAYDDRLGDEYLNMAFRFVQLGKNLLLFETIQDAQFTAELPLQLRTTLNNLNDRIERLDLTIFEFTATRNNKYAAIVDSLEQIKINALLQREQLYDQIDEMNVHVRSTDTDFFIAIDQLQGQVDGGSMIIDYYLWDTTLIISYLTRDHFNMEMKTLTHDLTSNIDKLLNGILNFHLNRSNEKADSIYKHGLNQYIEQSVLLHQLLIPTDFALPEKLILFPSGALNYLPFDLLLKSRPNTHDKFTEYPYLLRNHQIAYGLSPGILDIMRSRKSSDNNFLGIAPSFEEEVPLFASIAEYRRGNLGPLNWNMTEVENINRLVHGQILSGSKATKKEFVGQMNSHSILHIASHAKLNEETSDYSYIAFSGDADDPQSRLYLRSLYNLKIPSNMVVLSACETGTGELMEGEGINSLARGFTQAGAKSIVMSLWEVNDRSTAQIMTDFYRGLKVGKSKDEALRHAKLAYLDSQVENHLAHPFYWSAFVAMGDMEPLYPGHQYSKAIFIVSALLIVLLMLILMKRRRQ